MSTEMTRTEAGVLTIGEMPSKEERDAAIKSSPELLELGRHLLGERGHIQVGYALGIIRDERLYKYPRGVGQLADRCASKNQYTRTQQVYRLAKLELCEAIIRAGRSNRPPKVTPRQYGCVYFIQAGDDGPIKIGWAVNPGSRLEQIQRWEPVALHIRATTPGGRIRESMLHDQFAHLRLHGEWFRPAPDLLDYISNLPRDLG